MQTIIVAVGTTRGPKLSAMRDALAVIGPLLDPLARFEVVPVEVPSGVRHTPLSREETMAGARNRAEALVRLAREHGGAWRYFAGLEGGLHVTAERGARLVLLENWAYVTDGSGRGGFGQSGALPIPDALARRVVDDGAELGVAIDEFARTGGVRDAQGAWGVLTRGIITRQDAFRTAIINAFAPFYNRELYG